MIYIFAGIVYIILAVIIGIVMRIIHWWRWDRTQPLHLDQYDYEYVMLYEWRM